MMQVKDLKVGQSIVWGKDSARVEWVGDYIIGDAGEDVGDIVVRSLGLVRNSNGQKIDLSGLDADTFVRLA